MRRPILAMINAGRGETPACPTARFAKNAVVRVRRLKHLRHLPEIGAVVAVVPPGFPPEYALADAAGLPRPLMVSEGMRCVSYVIAFEGDQAPHHLRETYLIATDEPPANIAWADTSGGASS